ncbi:MAG TPA: hypothetical protein VJA16_04065 [Thermoanaerobaculia bacterium]
MPQVLLRWRRKRSHRLAPLLATILAAAIHGLPAAAAPPAAPAPSAEPRFLIEKISIEGVKRPGAQAIILSQSYLKTGRSYTERELQEAVYRIKRLPFVIGADLALRKGSERGRYELVVTVEETRPVFLDYSLAGTKSSFGLFYPNSVSWTNDGTLGLREFVGADGLAFLAISDGTSQARQLQAGYTQYDLFGNGSYASLTVADNLNAFQVSVLQLTGLVGIPLADNLTLIASPQWSHGSHSDVTDRSWGGTLGLVYRTTDDPIIPTRGTDLEASASGTHTSISFGPSEVIAENQLGLAWSATHYWPITRRQSLGLSLGGAAFRGSVLSSLQGSSTSLQQPGFNADLLLLYSASLWGGAATRRFGDLRFEISAGDTFAQYSQGFSSQLLLIPGLSSEARQVTASAGLVFRNEWGILRFSFNYYGKVLQ